MVSILVTATVYLPHVRGAAFVYEDLNDINTTYRPWQGWLIEAHDAAVRPARSLARAVDRIVGFDPVRQHAASLALHLLAGTLVFAVGLTVLSPLGAWIAATGWLWAPWNLETVAYAAARPDLLLTLAALVGVLAVERGRLWWAALAAVAAVLAKESGIVVWLLLPAWALWRALCWPRAWRWGWALAGVAGLVVAAGTRAGAFGWPPILTGLLALSNLILTPPMYVTVDPDLTAAWPLPVLAALVWASVWASRRWAALVWGGVLIAWLPRLLVPLAEGPHYHHLTLPLVALSLGAAKLATLSLEG